MSDDFLEEHLRGDHQPEIVAIIEAMQPAFRGHSRAICCFALARMLAVMLGPARQETRNGFIAALPDMLHGSLAMMDEMLSRTRS